MTDGQQTVQSAPQQPVQQPAADQQVSDQQFKEFFETQGGELAPEAQQPPAQPPQQPAGQPQGDQQKSGMVPHQALHEERQRRKEMQEQIAAMRQNQEAMERRFAQVLQAVSAPAAPQPNVEEDPVAYFQHETSNIKQTVEQLQQNAAAMQQMQQQQVAFQQFQQAYRSATRDFQNTTPDFMDAYRHLSDSRHQELVAMGYDSDTAWRIAQQNELELAQKCFVDGVNPGERLYGLAKMRGYVPKSPAAAQADARIQAVQQGQDSTIADSTSGAAPSAVKLTLAQVAAMSDADFDKLDWNEVAKAHG